MALKAAFTLFQGTLSDLASLPSTGHRGIVALAYDVNELFIDQGSGTPGYGNVGSDKAWIKVGSGTGGSGVSSINGLSGDPSVAAGARIHVAVSGSNIVVSATGGQEEVFPPWETPTSSDDQNFTLSGSPNFGRVSRRHRQRNFSDRRSRSIVFTQRKHD